MNIREIKKRLANATPGPWFVKGDDKRCNTAVVAEGHKLSTSNSDIHGLAHHIATIWNVTCTCIQGHQYDNQSFIAHARTDIEDMINYIEFLEGEIKRLTHKASKEAN